MSPRAAESFAGIAVPEGEPGALQAAAGQFTNLASSLSGVSGRLRAAPSSLAWSGPASVAFAGSCMTNGSGADQAVAALGQAGSAAEAFATELEDAQQRAEEAIEDARRAQERIDEAEKQIAAAQQRRAAAAADAETASRELAVTALSGTPSPGAETALAQAEARGVEAAGDETRARRELELATEALERAKKRGRKAMDDAEEAANAAANAFSGLAASSPAYAIVGAPAGGGGMSTLWNGRNDGFGAFDEDQFAAQLYPFHPKNDDVTHYKWWGDQAAGAGVEYAALTAVAYSRQLANAAVRDVPTLAVTHGRRFVSGPGGTIVQHTLTATRGTTTVIDAGLLAQAGRWSRAGRVLPFVGGGVAIAGAGWDQWREDARNPELSQTDRVGRAAGVGAYVGGASIAGAAIGTMIFPGVGTAAGLAIGATAGLLAGAAASAITPVKEAMADAGEWTANAAVNTVNWSGDRLQDIGDGIGTLGDKLSDVELPDIDVPDIDLPDVDMPDLNPF